MAGDHEFKPGVCKECGRPQADHKTKLKAAGGVIAGEFDAEAAKRFWDAVDLTNFHDTE